ncbi:MAG: patatin family protein [Eubacteriales bacterium]|nr:patatin family protein [Eubacteriales bacterium]
MKTGIVLEGGAMRGMFTAGVLDVFMENGIRFDGGVGVSAGATFGCNLKSEQIGRTVRYNLKYCRDPRYASVRSLIRTGDIFNAKFDYDDIPNRLDPYDVEAFMKNPMDFWVVATNVDTAEPVYHRLTIGNGPDIEWIRASASMPGFANIVYCEGESLTSGGPLAVMAGGNGTFENAGLGDGAVSEGAEVAGGSISRNYRTIDCSGLGLLDGGVSDSVPLKFMEDLGYEKIVVICTQPSGYRKKVNKLFGRVFGMKYKQYPALLDQLENRYRMYNAEMEYIDSRAAEHPDEVLLIRPAEKLTIKKIEHDPNEIKRTYDYGRAEGLRRLDDVRAFLARG